MAKGGKGRKGGGGGGKTRKYSRDSNGRFASTGTGATARGGRLATAKGNKRKTQTITATGQKGVLAKPKGLKPESTNRLKTGIFISKRRAVNAQLANKPDQAVVNIPGRFTGRAGKSFDASITRAVATVKASKDAQFKTKAEIKADEAKTKAAKEAKPKRVRSAESLRVSRAKQVEKRRSITTNPAGVRASAAAKMAANATRTQQRAAAFYKAGGKPAAAAAPKAAKAKTTAKPKPVKATEKQRNIREFMDQKGGIVARDYKRDAQAFRQPLAKKDQKPGGPKTVGGALEALTSKSFKRAAGKSALTQSESAQAQKLISDNNIKGYKVVRGERGDLLQRVSGVSGKSASLGESAATRNATRKPRRPMR